MSWEDEIISKRIEVSWKVMYPANKMDTEDKGITFKSEHEGKTYYFCNYSCKKKFDKIQRNLPRYAGIMILFKRCDDF